ncbi:nucleoid-associated protein [Clostridia bacterium]|nr:nucleoid-associated protein [Clostridia bacterium]
MAKGFNPAGGGMNMGGLMKQAQKMQKQLEEMTKELETKEFSASSGGGAVRVTATGKRILKEIIIDKDVVDSDDVEMLQDLILTAVNEALRTAEEAVNKDMGKITGGANLPGGLGGLF